MKLRFKWLIIGVVLSVFAVMTVMQKPLEAANFFTIANCFRPGLGSWIPWTQTIFNQHINNTVPGNTNIQVSITYGRNGSDWINIGSVMVNGQAQQAQMIAITHNSHGGTNCAGFTFFAESQTTAVYKLLNTAGEEIGYGLRRDCGNLVRYPVTPQGWQSEGETQVFSPTANWTKDHPYSAPLEVNVGDTVQWRHRINITGITGSPTFNIHATTQQTSGVVGANAIFNNHAVTVQGDGATRATNWYQRTWVVPESANPGDIFCQYWSWTPDRAPNPQTGNSRDDLRQCVEVGGGGDGTCPQMSGTTTLNGSNTDITVEPGASVTWAHTLSPSTSGPTTFTGTVNFSQNWTQGGGGSLEGGSAALPLTSPQVRTNSITVEEGDTVCQNLTWEVSGYPECSGQTAPVCATTLITGDSTEYVSTLRTCAIRQRAISGGVIENCVAGALGDSIPTLATNPTYAMTQDIIRFRHELNLLAQHQSRNPANYRPLSAFQQSRTRCETNPTQARNCLAAGTMNNVVPPLTTPTSPGQTSGLALSPAWLSPAHPGWNTASNACTLTGPQNNLGGQLAPNSCQVSDSAVQSNPNHTFQGTGRRVVNSDLGSNQAALTQQISLAQMRVTVHRNMQTHTISYTYQRRNSREVTAATDCGCFTPSVPCTPVCTGGSPGNPSANPPIPPIPCTPNCVGGSAGTSACPCSASTQYWWGSGNHPTVGCCTNPTNPPDAPVQGNATHANQDGTGSYTDNVMTWIEVMSDGPLQAEAAFAIPYNYYIRPQLGFFPGNAEKIQVGGTELHFAPSLQVAPRFESRLGETYATATRPDTRWRVIGFYLAPEVPNPNWGSNMTHDGGEVSCTTFSGAANNCFHNDGQGQLNGQSETNIWNLINGSTTHLGTQAHILADAPIGTKFCVAVAVADRDSTHNNGFGHISGNRWAMTTPECVVIGKKPMVNVIGDRCFNQALFERILVHEDTGLDVEYAAPFDTLLDQNLFTLKGEVERNIRDIEDGQTQSAAHLSLADFAKNRRNAKTGTFFNSAGLSKSILVRLRGLEPPHPCGHMDLNHARLPFRHSRLRRVF